MQNTEGEELHNLNRDGVNLLNSTHIMTSRHFIFMAILSLGIGFVRLDTIHVNVGLYTLLWRRWVVLECWNADCILTTTEKRINKQRKE